MKLKKFLKGTVVVDRRGGRRLGIPHAQAAETKGPVTDDIGVVMIPKGAPIFIGGYWTISGPTRHLASTSSAVLKSPWMTGTTRLPATRSSSSSKTASATRKAARPPPPSWPPTRTWFWWLDRTARAPAHPVARSSGKPAFPALPPRPPPVTDGSGPPEGLHGYLRTIYNDLSAGAADAEYFHGR